MNQQRDLDLIKKLSADLATPSETHGWSAKFWWSWAFCLLLIASAAIYTTIGWPNRAFFPSDLGQPLYWIEGAFWLLAAASAGICAYQSSFPIWPKTQAKTFSIGVILALFIFTAFRGGEGTFSAEMGLERGGCGIFIFIFGLVSAGWMFSVIRNAAPMRMAETAAWTAVSTGCLGATFMHFVCPHENFAHLLLWHCLPVSLLTLASAAVAKRTLSW